MVDIDLNAQMDEWLDAYCAKKGKEIEPAKVLLDGKTIAEHAEQDGYEEYIKDSSANGVIAFDPAAKLREKIMHGS